MIKCQGKKTIPDLVTSREMPSNFCDPTLLSSALIPNIPIDSSLSYVGIALYFHTEVMLRSPHAV